MRVIEHVNHDVPLPCGLFYVRLQDVSPWLQPVELLLHWVVWISHIYNQVVSLLVAGTDQGGRHCMLMTAYMSGKHICALSSWHTFLQWRQKVRVKEHKLIITEAAELDDQSEGEASPNGLRNLLQRGQSREVDVRQRTSGILLSDRTESWDQDDL